METDKLQNLQHSQTQPPAIRKDEEKPSLRKANQVCLEGRGATIISIMIIILITTAQLQYITWWMIWRFYLDPHICWGAITASGSLPANQPAYLWPSDPQLRRRWQQQQQQVGAPDSAARPERISPPMITARGWKHGLLVGGEPTLAFTQVWRVREKKKRKKKVWGGVSRVLWIRELPNLTVNRVKGRRFHRNPAHQTASCTHCDLARCFSFARSQIQVLLGTSEQRQGQRCAAQRHPTALRSRWPQVQRCTLHQHHPNVCAYTV